MKVRFVLCFTLLALLPARAAPEAGGSRADQDACQADVFRLCAEAIPDERRIVACLNQKAPELSPACHEVIDPAPRRARRKIRLSEALGTR